MGYPNTSASEVRELQARVADLEDLLGRYYSAAQAYVGMEHPTPKEETGYFEQMLELIEFHGRGCTDRITPSMVPSFCVSSPNLHCMDAQPLGDD